ncbi:MAG: BrnA antitoxin family protein [Elusimicrobia bacterium]|nr:BrnA antitoxin family protein [Elusimicrobiota bacterium]
MRNSKGFDFSKARRVTSKETATFRKAIENTFQIKRPARGRPLKGPDKYQDVHIRLHPKVLQWARARARHLGIGYQTFINATLLRDAA